MRSQDCTKSSFIDQKQTKKACAVKIAGKVQSLTKKKQKVMRSQHCTKSSFIDPPKKVMRSQDYMKKNKMKLRKISHKGKHTTENEVAAR